ncbi:MAG: carboxypeptidase regulatory-like domain-containing protein [Sphingobacteriaceae bacterium]|nr:carboxypeptidase regulatory-like domain-containing protein [Sphingobacteriaceae bacterium]
MTRLLLSFLLISSFLTQAQQIFIHFEGRVFDENSQVIGGASVLVKQNSLVYNSFSTDGEGDYNLYLPLNGEYQVIISKEGYVAKKYVVNTQNIPADKSKTPFADHVANVVLFTFYEGVDYSLFDEPMNVYSYNKTRDNICFDADYLHSKKEAMKELRKEQVKAYLAKLKADYQLKLGEEERIKRQIEDQLRQQEEIKICEMENTLQIMLNQVECELAVLSESTEMLKKSDVKSYKKSVEEQVFESKEIFAIQRIVAVNGKVWIYVKKRFHWGGVVFYRDKEVITEGIFEQETKKS